MEERLPLKNLTFIFGSVILSTVLIFVVVFLIFSGSDSSFKDAIKATSDSNGNQVITLKAKNGFEPKISSIQANKSATLKVDTSNTYDCSSTISIPKLGISSVLPASGEKEFTIPPQMAGTVIDGTCSMGMYNFKIVAQ